MIYVDTTALAKWYLPEVESERFSQWMADQERTWISTLTMVEMKSPVLGRVRSNELNREQADYVLDTFIDDIQHGFLLIQPVKDSTVSGAGSVLFRLHRQAHRTLDAIHLSVVADLGASVLATADELLGTVGEELGLGVEWFGDSELP